MSQKGDRVDKNKLVAKFKELNWGMKKEKREVFVALSLKSLHSAADLFPIFGLGLS